MPLQPFLSPPVQIPVAVNPESYAGPQVGEGVGPAYCQFQYLGNWYAVVMGDGSGTLPNPQVFIRQSTDGGATWHTLDGTHGPQYTVADTAPAGVFFDGNQTLIVAFTTNGNINTGHTDTLQLQNFNLATGTWGAIYGTVGAPSCIVTLQLFQRPDGSLIVLTLTGFNQTSASIFAGGIWVTTFRIDSNLPVGEHSADWVQSAMDSTGLVHCVLGGEDSFGVLNLYYQGITTGNTLGSFSLITVYNDGDFIGDSGNLFNTSPIIVNNQIIVGLQGTSTGNYSLNDYVTLAIGTPLSAPVWTVGAAPGLDGLTGNPPNVVELAIALTSDANGIYGAYIINSGATWTIRLGSTPNLNAPLSGWSFITAFNTTTAGVQNSLNYLGIAARNGLLSGTVIIPLAPASGANQFWLGDQGITPPAIAIQPQPAPVGGLPAAVAQAIRSARMSAALMSPEEISLAIADDPAALEVGIAIGGCKHLNDFDDCVLDEIQRVKKIQFPPLCVMPAGFDPYAMPWDEDFGAIPEQCVPFNKTGGILTPVPAAGDQIIFSFRVPTGYDGIMTALYFSYSGAGFVQGSGDIIFRVRRNQVYLKDLSNVPYLLGTSKLPVPMTQGALLQSNQLVSLIVNVPNLSGLIQVGNSTVFGGLIGFWWPRG